MSKIKEVLKDKESILVFDIDGVLAILEFGEYNHYALSDEDWDKANKDGINFYTEDKVCNKIKSFLNNKDMSRIYVITKAGNNNECEFKKEFANKYYDIPKENVYCVEHNTQKIDKLLEIKNKYKNIDDYKMVMIDDTVSILDEVKDKTNFSTAHVSSFFDI